MADWLKSMVQTFEFYIVDPNTWEDISQLRHVKSCTIDWDSEAETLGSASIDSTDEIGEKYIRVYLITIQNGVKERHPLGTFMAQTPSVSSNGLIKSITMDAYTPLIELKEKYPDIGYFIPKYTDSIEIAYNLLKDNMRAPVIEPSHSITWRMDNDTIGPSIELSPANGWNSDAIKSRHIDDILYNPLNDKIYKWGLHDGAYSWNEASVSNLKNTRLIDNFVSDPNETWISFLIPLLAKGKSKIELDGLGRVSIVEDKSFDYIQPIWTYNDDNSSILYPEIDSEQDLYGIPNAVEVVYSDNTRGQVYDCKFYNNDPNSPVSTFARGREILHRVINPDFTGIPSLEQVEEYAKQLLIEMSSVEYTVTYSHAYCPVKIGDCVRLNYARAGLINVKAKVISQSISCTTGCPVTEKASYSKKIINKKFITDKFITDKSELDYS